MERITIGITMFDRPLHLAKCLKSISAIYPLARIIVADNGEVPFALPRTIHYMKLPYDVGLAAARNAIVDTFATDYLLIMEEDIYFDHETRIERLEQVLDHVPEIGCVAGLLYERGDSSRHELMDFDVSCAEVRLVPSKGVSQQIPGGAMYRIGQMAPNFFLARREFLADHRWDERYRLWEHIPYFWEVRQAQRWRVAQCREVRATHDTGSRSHQYLARKRRGYRLRELFFREHGFNGRAAAVSFGIADTIAR